MPPALLKAVSAVPDLRPVYPPNSRRPRHALVSGERRALCGAEVKAIAPGRFDPTESAVCRRCQSIARLQG